jgi:hypothetical protein
MVEYVREYHCQQELADKVPFLVGALFKTAEKYMNGAILAFKRLVDAEEDRELAALEAHSYLSCVNVIFLCFDSIERLDKTDDNENDENMKAFWEQYEKREDVDNPLTPFKQARDFVTHINERIEYAPDIGSNIGKKALLVSSYVNGALIYYPRRRVKGKELQKSDKNELVRIGGHYYIFEEKSIPINETEFDKVKEVYSSVFNILNSRKKNSKYRDEGPNGFKILYNVAFEGCVGSSDDFFGPGLHSDHTFKDCVFHNW